MQFVFYNSFSNRDYFEMCSGSRPWDMFLLIEEGKFEVEFDGEGFVHTVGKNQIAYFPLNMHFKRRIIEPISFHQIGAFPDNSIFHKALFPGALNIPPENVEKISESLNIASGLKNNDLFLHYAESFVIENYIYCRRDDTYGGKITEDISFVINYMSEHIGEKINIEELAQKVHLSHVGLIWKFRHHLGTTPSDFLGSLRLQKAKQLLLESDLKINEISYICGFSNPYYFSKRFKEFFHQSPSKFREQMLNQ